jgi:hypothetical protein
MSANRRRHATVRAIWSLRAQAPARRETAWTIYLTVFLLLVIGLPVARALVLWGSRPMLLSVLMAPSALPIALAVVCAAGATAVGVGHLRGPAVLSRFFTATLAANDEPRRHGLGRPYLRSLAVLVAITSVLGGLLGAVLVSGAGAGPGVAVSWALCGLAVGLLLQAAWVIGEVAGKAVRRAVSALLLLATAALVLGTWAAPVAVGRWAAVMGVALGAPLATMGALAVGVVAAGCGYLALDRACGSVLDQQAARWESALTSAGTADLSGAAGTYRALPSAGRRLPAVGGGGRPVGLYVRRDVMGWMRHPARTTVGILGVLGGALLICAGPVWLPAVGPTLAGLATCVGALALWFASGVFVDGIRHGIESLGAPPLLGQGVGTQSVLHAIAPLLLVAALVLVAGVAFGAVVLVALVQAAVCIVGRIRDAAKGPMPLGLVAPMLTPEGDMSVLPTLLWQAEAPLIQVGSVLLGTLVLTLVGTPALVLVGAGVVAVLAADAARRVRTLSRAAR